MDLSVGLIIKAALVQACTRLVCFIEVHNTLSFRVMYSIVLKPYTSYVLPEIVMARRLWLRGLCATGTASAGCSC